MGNILADSVASVPHIKAFDTLAQQRFSMLDFSSLIPNLIDIVPANMLPYLATQRNVLGYKGWAFANTEAKQRALLKNARYMNSIAGTPYSIELAINNYGFPSTIANEYFNVIKFTEGLAIKYDGTYKYDGTQQYGAGAWAEFNVEIGYVTGSPPSTQQKADIINIINAWKPERCKLISVTYVAYNP